MAEAVTAGDGQLVVEDRFSIVPEWLLDADVSDSAVRLYAVLLRYGQSSGARMPSRATLARRLRKKSVDSVDRAMRDLVDVGAVVVQARYAGSQRLTNLYHVRTSRPPAPDRCNSAATRLEPAGGGRTDAAGVAAAVRLDPESLTQSTPPPPEQEMAHLCAVADWSGFVERCIALRRQLGRPVGRWSGPCLAAALALAVRGRGWPADRAAAALLAVAADPQTRSPMRLAEAGPWWDATPPVAPPANACGRAELVAMERALAELDGARVHLQAQARAQLAAEGIPVTRATVTERAYQLHTATSPAADGGTVA